MESVKSELRKNFMIHLEFMSKRKQLNINCVPLYNLVACIIYLPNLFVTMGWVSTMEKLTINSKNLKHTNYIHRIIDSFIHSFIEHRR